MPRRKVSLGSNPPVSPKKLTQTTLVNIFGSSPCSASPVKSVLESPSPKRTLARSRRPPFRATLGESDDDDSSNDVGAIRFEEDVVDASSDDEQPHLSPMKKRRTRVASFDNLEPFHATNAGSDDELDSKVHWKGKGKQGVVIDSDDSGRVNKRRLVRGERPPSPEDEDDILEDLDEDSERSQQFCVIHSSKST